MVHQPAVDVAQHLAVETMVAGIRLEGDSQTAGTEGCDDAAGVGEWMASIPGAVDHKNRQIAAGLEPPERTETRWQPAVDGDYPGEPLGMAEAKPIGDGCTLAASYKEDPFRMDVEQASGLADRREDRVLEQIKIVGLGLEEGSTNDFGLGPLWRLVRAGMVMKLEIPPPAKAGQSVASDDGFRPPKP